MPIFSPSCDSIDDLLLETYRHLDEHGEELWATRGATLEITGVALELTNPRARLSRSEMRGIVLSCLGELCWYLRGADGLSEIESYIARYQKEAIEDGHGRLFVPGAYGPRLFGSDSEAALGDQVRRITKLLRQRPSSRKAVLQLFSARDLEREARDGGDVPCTCIIQFLLREERLDAVTYMRSNDAWFGLPHDIFCFSMLQEIVARDLQVELGYYRHMVGSLHIYLAEPDGTPTKYREDMRDFIREGYQTTLFPMPPMPEGNPWDHVSALLDVEHSLRAEGAIWPQRFDALPPYWQDLARLLQAYHLFKLGSDSAQIASIRDSFHTPSYQMFLARLLRTSQSPSTPRVG